MKNKSRPTPQESGDFSPHMEATSRFRDFLSAGEFTLLQQASEHPLHPAIRINRLKTNPETAIPEWIDCYGWQVKRVPFCESGWWITESQQPISHTVEHRMGCYYIQEAASMLPVSLFDFKNSKAPLVLDMAASPGGKTTHLIDRTHDMGLVLANDPGRERIMALRLVLQTWGGLNTATTRYPGEKFGGWFPETFDYVLLDAPCSMQSLRSSASHPIRKISEKEIQTLSRRQERLLLSAFRAAKIGGQIVYSTCTLTVEENEAVLEALLQKFGSAVKIENLAKHLPSPAPALSSAEINGQRIAFADEIQGAARLWPHLFDTSGFFAALITKVSSVEATPIERPARPLRKTGLAAVKHKEANDLIDLLHQRYGFDFQPVLERQNLSLWKNKDILYAIPQRWFDLFSEIPFQSIGMRIGRETRDGFIPSHEWVSRFGNFFTAGYTLLEEEQASAWLRGEDMRGKPDTVLPKGAIILVRDRSGRIFGRGKVLADRLKNLLPSRLVY